MLPVPCLGGKGGVGKDAGLHAPGTQTLADHLGSCGENVEPLSLLVFLTCLGAPECGRDPPCRAAIDEVCD